MTKKKKAKPETKKTAEYPESCNKRFVFDQFMEFDVDATISDYEQVCQAFENVRKEVTSLVGQAYIKLGRSKSSRPLARFCRRIWKLEKEFKEFQRSAAVMAMQENVAWFFYGREAVQFIAGELATVGCQVSEILGRSEPAACKRLKPKALTQIACQSVGTSP